MYRKEGGIGQEGMGMKNKGRGKPQKQKKVVRNGSVP